MVATLIVNRFLITSIELSNMATISMLLCLVVCSLLVYKVWKRQMQREVGVVDNMKGDAADNHQEEDRYAAQMGCKAPRRWAAKWPQGLDLLLKAGRHARAQTILQFFLDVVDSSGPTHEQQLRESSKTKKPKKNCGVDTA